MLLLNLFWPLAVTLLVYLASRALVRRGYWALLVALHHFRAGRLNACLAWTCRCLDAPRVSPRRKARAYYLNALVYLQQQNKARALQQLRLAHPELHREYWPNLMLGLTLVELHEAEEALPPLRKAASLQPRDARAWFAMGWAHARLRRVCESYAALSRCLQRDPTHQRARELLAEICLQMGRYDECLHHLTRLGEPAPRLWMGQKLLNWSRHEEALFWLHRQLEEQDQLVTRTLLASALREQGRTEESIEQYNQVLSQKLCWQALWGRALAHLQSLEHCSFLEQERRMALIRRDIAWADELSGGGCRDLVIQRAKIGRELLPICTKTYVN